MIVAKDLTKYYGFKPALEEVSFEIGSGEIVGFLGPNGAGKTTILKIVTCFMPPTAGKVQVGGLDTRDHSLEVRRMIGFLPESVPLYNDLRVERFLAFAASVKGVKGRKVSGEIDRVVEVSGLGDHRKRLIRHLSKGLKQRVGLAQALLNDPPVLILDEPTEGLDPAQIIDIRELIRNFGGEKTVLLSSHILPEVSHVCQRVVIVNKGRVVAEDSPENLTGKVEQKRGSHTIINVEGPDEEIEKKLISIDGVVSVDRVGEGRFSVESMFGKDIRPMLARTIVEASWGLKEMHAKNLSLEDVFVQLITEEDQKNHLVSNGEKERT